jgi:tetratricopeptide (TPR) repeat protein
LKRGLLASPGQANLALLLGGEYAAEGKYEEVIALYESVLEANPNARMVANNLASTLLDHRDDEASHQQALQMTREFSESRNPVLLDTVGWAYFRNGDSRRAVQFLELALALGGDVPIVHYHLASAYAASGDRVGADRQLEEFLRRVPDDNPRRAELEAEVRRLMVAGVP